MKIEKGINEPKLKQVAALLLEAGYSNIVVYATRVKKTGTTLYWQHISAGWGRRDRRCGPHCGFLSDRYRRVGW